MPVTTRLQTRSKSTNLNNLPAEIILLIANYLDAAFWKDFNTEKTSCACLSSRGGSQRMVIKTWMHHPRLALASVSRRLRSVFGDSRLNHSLATAYCPWRVNLYRTASANYLGSIR
jgi:hypothetical protein